MKKQAYISLNMAEYEALMTKASFAEITMYLILKKLANFKTGQVGGYRNQKLNYEKLGQIVSRPKRNTAPAEIYDRNKARYLIEKLENMGLVAQVKFENDSLKLRLPFSPMNDVDEVKAPEPASLQEILEECQQASDADPLETRMDFDSDEFDPFAISTDSVQYKHYLHHLNTVGKRKLESTDKGEGTSPSGAISAIHPVRSSKNEEGKSAQLTVESIANRLAPKGFRLLETPLSKTIMSGWVTAGTSETELETAITKLASAGGNLIAGELDKILRGRRKSNSKDTKKSALVL